MGFRINTNVAALDAHRAAMNTNRSLDKSLASLSSGLRINKAADDASGMTIADSLRSQAQGLGQAISNANDGVAVVQTADGALDEYVNIINSVRTKSIQAASDGQNADSRKAIQADIDRLLGAADSIANTTQFNGQKLLDGSYSNKAFHIGAYAGETVSLSVGSVQVGSVGDISAVQGTSNRGSGLSTTTNLDETSTGYTLKADQLTVNGTDISGTLNAQSPQSLTSAKNIASAITSATGILAQATTTFTGTTVAAGSISSASSLTINGTTIADTAVSASDADGALSSAINAVSQQTGVTAKTVNGALELTSKDGSNISIGGTSTVSVAQVDTIKIPTGGTAEAGDIYSVVVDSNPATGAVTLSHTVGAAESMTDVLTQLAVLINGDSTANALLSADASTGELILTGLTSASAFTSSSTIGNIADVNIEGPGAVVASGQSSDQKIAAGSSFNSGKVLTDPAGAFADGDKVTFTDGATKTWEVEIGLGGADGLTTASTMQDALDALAVKINAETANTYTASAVGGELSITPTTSSTVVPNFAASLTFNPATGTMAAELADGVASAGLDVQAGVGATYSTTAAETGFAFESQDIVIADYTALTGDTQSFTIGGLTIDITSGATAGANDVSGEGIAALLDALTTTAGSVVNSATNAFGASNVSITGTVSADWDINASATSATVTALANTYGNKTATAVADATNTNITSVTDNPAGVGVATGDTVTWTDGATSPKSYTYTATATDFSMQDMMIGLTTKIDLAGDYNASYNTGTKAFAVASTTGDITPGFAGALSSVVASAATIAPGAETNDAGTLLVPATEATFTSFKLEAGASFGTLATGNTFTWSDGATTNAQTATVTVGTTAGITTASSFNDIMSALATEINTDPIGAGKTYVATYDSATQKLTTTADVAEAIVGFNPQMTATAGMLANIPASGGYVNAGTTGTNATGTFTMAALTNFDAGDIASFDIFDGTDTVSIAHTTVAGQSSADVLTALQGKIATAASALFSGGVTSSVNTTTGIISIAAVGKTGEALTITDTSTNSGVNADAALVRTTATSSASVGSYDTTGLTDKLTNRSSTATVATLDSTATAAVTLVAGDLVINGQDMAGTYGDGTNAGTAGTALQTAIQSISGMSSSTINPAGTIALIVDNGDDLNISGVKATGIYKLAEGITNESATGKVDIFSNNDVQIAGTVPASFGFTSGNFTPTSTGSSLSSIDVTTRESAEKAVLIADSALKQLDATRSDLGSVQNQLESTIRNISVTQVNVTAAESNIRDVDFAQESANFAKFNILAQSGSYAMSQANAVQQNVLRLLQ